MRGYNDDSGVAYISNWSNLHDHVIVDFFRFRFGIGRPEEKSEVGNYVLSNFSPEEQSELEQLIQKSVDMILHQ